MRLFLDDRALKRLRYSEYRVDPNFDMFRDCCTSFPFERHKMGCKLPTGVIILGERQIGSGIFMRDCYEAFQVSFEGGWSENKHVIVIGTPGIGKTFFGYAMLIHIVSTSGRVIYADCISDLSYVFSADKPLPVEVFNIGAVPTEEHVDDSYHICDS